MAQLKTVSSPRLSIIAVQSLSKPAQQLPHASSSANIGGVTSEELTKYRSLVVGMRGARDLISFWLHQSQTGMCLLFARSHGGA